MATGEPSPQAWHALTAAEVAARLASDAAAGLMPAEAERRLAAWGANAIDEAPPFPWWRRLARQFQEVMIAILLVAAVVACALGEWADATAIVAIVLVNGLIGFLQEERAQRALATLRQFSAPNARVVRGGRAVIVPAREVVVGDLIVLEAGDHVPADARLV
ncbi:MAG: ATPase, partial [Planctomycetia bacterium]|nr:ATPase [Planctomycetia bacterium]